MSYVQKFLPHKAISFSLVYPVPSVYVEILMKITHNRKIFFLSFGQIMCKHYLSINKWKRPKENSLWGWVPGKWEVVIVFCSLVCELYIPSKYWERREETHCSGDSFLTEETKCPFTVESLECFTWEATRIAVTRG